MQAVEEMEWNLPTDVQVSLIQHLSSESMGDPFARVKHEYTFQKINPAD
jgi:hypothetical protein